MTAEFLLYNKFLTFTPNFKAALLLRNMHKPHPAQLFAECFTGQESEAIKICP